MNRDLLIDMMAILHELANPPCNTPEEASRAKIIWEAVRSSLEARNRSYADIITARVEVDHERG